MTIPIEDIEVTVLPDTFPEGTVLLAAILSEDSAGLSDEARAVSRVSGILSLIAVDANGDPVQPLQPVKICFTPTSTAAYEGLCLAFVNEMGEWECVDVTVVLGEDGQMCGETPHFTLFAILPRAAEVATPSPIVLNTATRTPLASPSSLSNPIPAPVPVAVPVPVLVPVPVPVSAPMPVQSLSVVSDSREYDESATTRLVVVWAIVLLTLFTL